MFRSTAGGAAAGVWKADADGRHAVQLVPGGAAGPDITPDDRQVIFISSRSGIQSLWMVPLEGGTPTHIENEFFGAGSGVDVSPDGKSIIFVSRDDQDRATPIVCDLPACTSRRILMDLGLLPRWMPDGRALAYVDAATRSNLWAQPLDGGPPRQLTHFTDGRTIVDFAWSRDGKRLAIARSTTSNDIILFKGLKAVR